MEETRARVQGGPWLQAACLCEQAIIAVDGSISLINLFDQVRVSLVDAGGQDAAVPVGLDGKRPRLLHSFKIAIVLKGGDASGDVLVEIEVEPPDGKSLPAFQQSATLGANEGGANIVVNARFGFDQEGLYWFSVKCDSRLLTRMPLRVLFQPAISSQETGAVTPPE